MVCLKMLTSLFLALSFFFVESYAKPHSGETMDTVDLPIPNTKLDQDGIPQVFETEDFVVALYTDFGDAKVVAEETGFQYVYKVLKNLHVFRRTNPDYYGSTERRIDAALENLQEHPMVLSVEKQEKEEIQLYTNDQGWPYMFYMNGEIEIDMNITATWDRGYSGKNVTIAIVDDGIDFGNTDLNDNMNLALSLNTLDMTNVPYPSDFDAHGTKCAGTALAIKDNGVCGVGSAHEATLVGIKFFKSSEFVIDDARTALALTHRNDVIDIYSNSWGSGKFSAVGPLTQQALETGTTEGRNGLGSIYLFSAGNGGPDDTCNHDERSSNVRVITISSVQYGGKPATYAENCPAVLATTYGGDEVNGQKKYLIACGRGNSCKLFDGTSSSTPLAAGMVALMLQANPNLTWRDVQHIIVQTSISDGIYADWFTNGAGYKVSPRLGFGLMNADAMVTAALSWTTVPTMESCIAVQQSPELEPLTTEKQSSLLELQSCKGDNADIDVLEKVQVTLSFTAETFGDVLLNLTSPMGTTSSLSVGHPAGSSQSGSPSQYYGHTFTSVHFWGENPIGTWKLDALLRSTTALGKIRHWTLTLYGTYKFGETTSNSPTSTLSSTNSDTSITTAAPTSNVTETPEEDTTISTTTTTTLTKSTNTGSTSKTVNATFPTMYSSTTVTTATTSPSRVNSAATTVTDLTPTEETSSVDTSIQTETTGSIMAQSTTPIQSTSSPPVTSTIQPNITSAATTIVQTSVSTQVTTTQNVSSTQDTTAPYTSDTTNSETSSTLTPVHSSGVIVTETTQQVESTTQQATTTIPQTTKTTQSETTTRQAETTPKQTTQQTTRVTQQTTKTTSQQSTGGNEGNQWYIPVILAIAIVISIGTGLAVMVCIVKKPLKINPVKSLNHKRVHRHRDQRRHRRNSRSRRERSPSPDYRMPRSARTPADIFLENSHHGQTSYYQSSLNF